MTMREMRQKGFTLLELMIAVAVVGILATTAMFLYTKYIKKARTSEVPSVFAQFRLRLEQFAVENDGRYLSTGASDADYWPPTPSGSSNPTLVTPMPLPWQQLRIEPPSSAVYCSYVVRAGLANDATNIGPVANSFGMVAAPAMNWFYMIAECDMDDDATTNSFYFARSDLDGIARRDVGK